MFVSVMTGTLEARAHHGPRIEGALRRALDAAVGEAAPPRLRGAIERAVFGAGARMRPALCLAVAAAHGDPNPAAADDAAVAVELIHCASLVHDDLPCFDDALLRRGRPTIHVEFGVPTAVLAGDALIVTAFGALATARDPRLVSLLAEAAGAARGLVAGQAWEEESGDRAPSIDAYHRAKTASLFAAAAAMGAICAGAEPAPWSDFGVLLGSAYQAIDDILDAASDASVTGKTSGRDALLERPSVVRAYGLGNAKARVGWLVDQAARRVPSCGDAVPVRDWLSRFAHHARSAGARGP